jgi:hypothetical protein
MEADPGDSIYRARRLIDTSRRLVNDAKARIETAQERLDRARNVLQVTWLLRTLRQRLRRRDS